MLTNVAFSSQSGNGVAFLQRFLPALVGVALIIGILFFFYMLVTGGIAWLSSNGDKGGVETARNKVSNALIGIVMLLSLFALVGFIGNFFKLNLTTINIHSLFDTAGGGGGTGGGGGGSGTGIAACGCVNGGCAQLGAIALGNQAGGTTCNECTANGWVVVPGICSGNNPITCGTCP